MTAPAIARTHISVRPALDSDVPWIVRQLQDFAAFYGTKHSLFPDVETACRIIVELLDVHPFFIACDDAAPIGLIAGTLSPHPYNPQKIALTELFWWVDEAYRGGRAGLELLELFLAFGRAAKADMILMTLEAKSPVNPRCLEKRGFHLHERAYLMELP